MKTILLATNNPHKVEELRTLAAPLNVEAVSPGDLGLELEVDEVGTSFAENAILKAEAFRDASGYPALADDSGLVVDALGGEPGLYSARYGGPGLDDMGRVRLVLDRMREVPDSDRSAHFVAAIAVATWNGATMVFQDSVEGRITRAPRGENGFGYDPIFYYPPYDRTLAESSAEEKSVVSHRGKAMRRALEYIESQLEDGILGHRIRGKGF